MNDWKPSWISFFLGAVFGFGLAWSVSGAQAQTVSSNTAGTTTAATCSANGETWIEQGFICHSDPMFRKTLIGPGSSAVETVRHYLSDVPLPSGAANGVTIQASPMPKCEDGWTLVMDGAMQPMCARELRKPQ